MKLKSCVLKVIRRVILSSNRKVARGMFSVPRSPVQNNREGWHGLVGFISAMRITMLLFHPVSYRVGHHRHHRSTSLLQRALVFHSCHSLALSVSFCPRRVAGITHREFQLSATASQFPLNPISFTGKQQREPRARTFTANLVVDAEDNAFPITRHAIRTVCIYQGVYRSQLFQLSYLALSR